jgi:hypothetical protein
MEKANRQVGGFVAALSWWTKFSTNRLAAKSGDLDASASHSGA